MFYGGVYIDSPKYTDVSEDGQLILVCGESYSYNFVNKTKTMEAFLMLIDAETGMFKWGKYY